MIKNKNFKLIIFALMFSFVVSHHVSAIDDSILDPLGLDDKSNTSDIINDKLKVKSYITAITADGKDKRLTITGMPQVNALTDVKGEYVYIKLRNSVLHKSIAAKSYNWKVKLVNHFEDVVDADVIAYKSKKEILVKLRFKYPVSVDVIQKNKSTLQLWFERNEKKTLNNSYIAYDIDNKQQPEIQSSGKYVTIPAGTKVIKLSDIKIKTVKNPQITSTYNVKTDSVLKQNKLIKPDNGVKLAPGNVKAPASYPGLPVVKKDEKLETELKLGPGEYERSENDFIDKPKQLPALQRPERTQNDLLEKNDYDDLVRIALSLEAEGNFDGAIQKYSQAVIVDKDRYEAYSALGDVYLKKENYNLAIENYNKSLNSLPDQPKALFNLGVCYYNLKDYKSAYSSFDKVLALQPEDYEANYHIANILFIKEDYASAIKYYEKCLKLTNKSKNNIELSKLHYNIANCYKAQDAFEKAIKEYIKTIKLHPGFADAYYNLAATYVNKGDYKSAINEFNEYKKYTTSKEELVNVDKIIDQLKKSID